MAELNLPNIREGGNIRFRIGLEDGGVAVDWSGLEDIRVFLYADAQKQVSGEMCEVAVDEEDNTVLKCKYSGDDVQYRGINSVLVRAKYLGEIKVYDKPAINIVARTSEADGVIVVDDPVVPVQISVEDVSTSLLNNAIDAAINAAAEAEAAAHLVPLQVLEDCVEATGKALEAASKAPYIDETTGNWFVWDAEAGEYVDSGRTARGATGNGIASWSVVESQEDAGNNVVTVTFTDGTSESFNVKNGHTGNGIASIVQTVESPDDAGTNVITITMTNGTVVTFNVKNGSKGTPGVAQAAYKSVSSLPTASAQTMDMIYLTPSGTSGVYNMSYTEFDGSAYSWQDLGTTAIQLSDYATKAELSQLQQDIEHIEHKVDGKTYYDYDVNGQTTANTFLRPAYNYTDIDIPAGTYNITADLGGTFSMIAFYLYDADGNVLTLTNKNGQSVSLVGSDVIDAQSPYTIPSGTVRVGFYANDKIEDGDFTFHFENTAVDVPGLTDKVENLETEIGDKAKDEAKVITGTLTSGAEFTLVGSVAVNIPAGVFVKMTLSGTATASTIRVYQNAAPSLFWANPAIGDTHIEQATGAITSLLLYSNCDADGAGTIRLDISYTIPGSGLGGDVSNLQKSIVQFPHKWVALGDSITAQGKYIPQVVQLFGMTDVLNLGIGGITVCNNGGSTYMSKDSYLATIPNDAALITLMGGVNDWAQSATIGNVDSSDTTEYCGALNHIIDYIYQNHPSARFVIMCPTPGTFPSRFTTGDGDKNNIGKTVLDYAAAAVAVCEARGCAVARIGQQVGWNAKNINTYTVDDGAHIHPNEAGGGRIAAVLAGYLKAVLPLKSTDI